VKGLSITVGYADEDDVLLTFAVAEFDGGLRELQAVVGGNIEAAPADESVTLWINEDGKGLDLPANRLAMDVWLRWDIYRCMLVGGDWLAGNCVVTGGVGPDGETLDLPEEARRWVLTVARDAGVEVPRPDWERFGLVDE
jgi:hypothetical protein